MTKSFFIIIPNNTVESFASSPTQTTEISLVPAPETQKMN